jgi:hypothetical protein
LAVPSDAVARGGPAGEPKRWGYRNKCRARKRMLTCLPARRGPVYAPSVILASFPSPQPSPRRSPRRCQRAQRPSSGQRQPPGIGDPHPDNLDRPLASMHGLGRRRRRPSCTRSTSISIVKPCASMIASVTPSGLPASNRSARCHSALIAMARCQRRSAPPVAPASSAGRRHR